MKTHPDPGSVLSDVKERLLLIRDIAAADDSAFDKDAIRHHAVMALAHIEHAKPPASGDV